ncbi:MAG: hypothetical protein JSS30_01655 [Verrucomicrobia bacterium]|nr:hypothetical protein [Verrucomicrobiota bacterium]
MWRGALIFLLLCGCGPNNSEDFLTQSEEKCSELVAILEKAESLDDLLKVESDLKKKFNEIGTLMVQSRKFHEKHPSALPVKPIPSSAALLDELKRIYAIKGGREVIERAQSETRLW